MTAVFWASYVLLWVFMFIALILLLLIYRQYGRMYMSNRQRINLGGVDIGKKLPRLGPDELDSGAIEWPADESAQVAGTFALLATGSCAVCAHLKQEAEFLSLPFRFPAIRFVWIDTEPEQVAAPALNGWYLLYSSSFRAFRTLDVPATPFAYICDAKGIVRGKGLINHGGEAESLLTSSLPSSPSSLASLTPSSSGGPDGQSD